MQNITYNENNHVFHIKGNTFSYIMQIYREGYLAHIYWGKQINDYHNSFPIRMVDRAFSPNPDKDDRAFSLDTLPQEYPSYGHTDFRSPAIELETDDGTRISDFRYLTHRIQKGKPTLDGLPHTYANETEAESLVITLKDSYTNIELDLVYTVFINTDVLTRSVRITNNGENAVKIIKLYSLNIDFRSQEYNLLHLPGAWGRERHIIAQQLNQGTVVIESKRGASSHQHNPFVALVEKNYTETYGEIFSFNLVYSGDFRAQIELDSFNTTRVQMGLNHETFQWNLESGDSFQTPEVVMVYSSNGLSQMTSTYHKLYNNHLIRGHHKLQERPILINNWEATYFDFTEESILDIANQASKLGIELFVLDDGWFGQRDDDKSSLGDWNVNTVKIPNGLDTLANKINQKNMKFGLWFEPEMVSENSALYRQHPEWCLQVKNRRMSESRNQLTLDFSQKDVRDNIYTQLSTIFRSTYISYVKWDMNRHMTEAYSLTLPKHRKMETRHRYILGLYELLEKLTTEFPHILFESCSGGGGRFDPGMMYYMPQTWTSDNTDAIDRIKIQYGTSLVYPISSMGSHISMVPNHQIHRITPLQTRACVAMSGNMGYELDLTKQDENDLILIKDQVSFYKKHRKLIQYGEFYRLQNPFESNNAAWIFVSDDKSEALVYYFKTLSHAQESFVQLKLNGLDENALYAIDNNHSYSGEELHHIGLPIPQLEGDFQAICMYLKQHKR